MFPSAAVGVPHSIVSCTAAVLVFVAHKNISENSPAEVEELEVWIYVPVELVEATLTAKPSSAPLKCALVNVAIVIPS